MDKKIILKNGVRIFRPIEVQKLISSIPKIEYRDKFEALLFTGCRYSEMQWLYKHPGNFLGNSILMPSMKPQARHKERYIRLNHHGQRAVAYFLRSKRNLPAYPGWDENLKRWCEYAGIPDDGVCCKSTRKTWESWLTTMYPRSFQNIFLSMGHTERISLEFYLMLPFDEDDRQLMKYYTEGWL